MTHKLDEIKGLVWKERQKRGLTQAELAAAAGVSKSRVEQIEAGNWEKMRISTLSAVLNCLELQFRVEGIAKATASSG